MTDRIETVREVVRILVVEDSPTQLQELRYLLEDAGYSVIAAGDGLEALALARAAPVDLVISDVMMPGMDGYELCRAMRADPSLRHLPVILLTSLGDPRDVIQGLESGANNFICKPYEHRALLGRVKNVLANQEIRKSSTSEMGISIFFAGHQFFITADRLQILDLLLSTYENAVDRNTELLHARDELRLLNEQLEERVAERTAALTAEVAERERAQAGLQASEARLRSFIDHAPYGVFLADEAGRYLEVNPEACRMTGYDPAELLSRSIPDMLSPDSLAEGLQTFQRLATEGESRVDLKFVHKSGQVRWWSIAAVRLSPTRYLGYVADITDRLAEEQRRRDVEARTIHRQRLESIGTLASGMAHEINNPINVIMNYAQLIGDEVPPGGRIAKNVGCISAECERIAGIVKNLLAFARLEKESHSPARLQDILGASVALVGRSLMSDQIRVDSDIPDDLPKVQCRSQQIQQVVVNLLTNARDALNARYPKGHPDKVIRIAVRLDSLEGVPALCLTVEDHGCGIPDTIRDRIFEPFFTTKPRGVGTGLGLSISHGIIEEHRGELTVESGPEKPTRFSMFLKVDNGWQKDWDGPAGSRRPDGEV